MEILDVKYGGNFIFNKEKIFNKIMNQQTILTTNYSISRGKSILFGNEYDFLIINYSEKSTDRNF